MAEVHVAEATCKDIRVDEDKFLSILENPSAWPDNVDPQEWRITSIDQKLKDDIKKCLDLATELQFPIFNTGTRDEDKAAKLEMGEWIAREAMIKSLRHDIGEVSAKAAVAYLKEKDMGIDATQPFADLLWLISQHTDNLDNFMFLFNVYRMNHMEDDETKHRQFLNEFAQAFLAQGATHQVNLSNHFKERISKVLEESDLDIRYKNLATLIEEAEIRVRIYFITYSIRHSGSNAPGALKELNTQARRIVDRLEGETSEAYGVKETDESTADLFKKIDELLGKAKTYSEKAKQAALNIETNVKSTKDAVTEVKPSMDDKTSKSLAQFIDWSIRQAATAQRAADKAKERIEEARAAIHQPYRGIKSRWTEIVFVTTIQTRLSWLREALLSCEKEAHWIIGYVDKAVQLLEQHEPSPTDLILLEQHEPSPTDLISKMKELEAETTAQNKGLKAAISTALEDVLSLERIDYESHLFLGIGKYEESVSSARFSDYNGAFHYDTIPFEHYEDRSLIEKHDHLTGYSHSYEHYGGGYHGYTDASDGEWSNNLIIGSMGFIFVVFCLGLAFGLIVCFGYKQKKESDERKDKEEDWRQNDV
eukprot:1160889_1